MQLGILIVRVLVLMAATAAGFALAHALALHAPNNLFLGGAGFLAGVLVVLLEWQAPRIPVCRLFWGATGPLLGAVLGLGLATPLAAPVPAAAPLRPGLVPLLPAAPGARVDRRRVELRDATSGKMLTNDYTLNGVAELSGVAVLNVTELPNALKPVVLPGEPLHVHIVKEGKEANQGVAYLDGGTMVVVEHGKRLIGQPVDVTVTTISQTAPGPMIFARHPAEESGSRGPPRSSPR